ncbi:MAG: hypothetical protein FJX95_11125 [Bacteroidetes bacterium]|nr:hypothetical protein [Bacteroidota bacterium]
MAVYWVTEGADRCIVGRLPFFYNNDYEKLNGRLAQVVRILPFGVPCRPGSRTEYSNKYSGVMHVLLIGISLDDTPVAHLNQFAGSIDEISSSEEEELDE